MNTLQTAFRYDDQSLKVTPVTTIATKKRIRKPCKFLSNIMQKYGTCYINTVLNAIMFTPYLSNLVVAQFVAYLRQMTVYELKSKVDTVFKFETDASGVCYPVPTKEDDLQSILYKLIMCNESMVDASKQGSLVRHLGYSIQEYNPNEGGYSFEIMVSMLKVMKAPFIMMSMDDITLLNQPEYAKELEDVMKSYDIIMQYRLRDEVAFFCLDVIHYLLYERLTSNTLNRIVKDLNFQHKDDLERDILPYINSISDDIKQTIVDAYTVHVFPKYNASIRQIIGKHVQGNELRFIDNGKFVHLYNHMLSFIVNRIPVWRKNNVKDLELSNLYDTYRLKTWPETILQSYEINASLINFATTSSAHDIVGMRCNNMYSVVDSNRKYSLMYNWNAPSDTSDAGNNTIEIIKSSYKLNDNPKFVITCLLYCNKHATQKVSDLVESLMLRYEEKLHIKEASRCDIPKYELELRQNMSPANKQMTLSRPNSTKSKSSSPI